MHNLLRMLPGAALAGLACCQAGCMSPSCSQAGWRFEYLKPPTIAQNMVVASGPAPVGLVGTSQYGTAPMSYAVAPQAPPVVLQSAPAVVTAPAPMYLSPRNADCTLQDACDRIKALEGNRPTLIRPNAERLGMPAPKATGAAGAAPPCE